MAKLFRGAAVPLFDRLSLSEASDTPTQFDAAQLRASIGRDIIRLLNTRSRLSFAEYRAGDGTVLDYGVPDFSILSIKNGEDIALLEETLGKAIARYEPRLKDVQAHASARPGRPGAALVSLSGVMTIGLQTHRVEFELPLQELRSGEVKVEGS